MNLYISREQARSMSVERCLRCHRVRSLAFFQVAENVPVVLSVDDVAKPVKIQEFCVCGQLEGEKSEVAG